VAVHPGPPTARARRLGIPAHEEASPAGAPPAFSRRLITQLASG
jgi:hypothetical protein